MSDRRNLSVRELGILVTLMLNFGGLVWAAAITSKTVGDLKDVTKDLTTTTRGMSTDITQIKIDYLSRLNALEIRVSANERTINDLNKKVRGY